MAFVVRIGVALAILLPFFLLVPSPPLWMIFVAAIVAFGSGRIVAHLVVGAPKPVSTAEDRLEPIPPEAWGTSNRWIVRVIVVVVLIAMVVGVALTVASDRDAAELARTRPPAPIVVPEPIAVPEPFDAPEPPALTIDLDGATARMPEPSGWSAMGSGSFVRSSGSGEFLVDTLLVQADCFGACETLDANMKALRKYWRSSRVAYGLRFSLDVGKVRQPAPDRVAFDVELRSHAPESPHGRARVLAIRPPGAKRALLCEVLVFGDADALADAAAVCETIAIE